MYKKLSLQQTIKNIGLFCLIGLLFVSCNGKLPGGDARKNPADPKLRVKKNLEEGRGFQVGNLLESKSGTFDFASSNELWRASLDTIDFIPLTSVNYSGGVIISDWYSSEENSNESIKISIRFLTNEVRSDALDIKVFNRKCDLSLVNCKISQNKGTLVTELKKEILKKAALYKQVELQKTIEKNRKKNNTYTVDDIDYK